MSSPGGGSLCWTSWSFSLQQLKSLCFAEFFRNLPFSRNYCKIIFLLYPSWITSLLETRTSFPYVLQPSSLYLYSMKLPRMILIHLLSLSTPLFPPPLPSGWVLFVLKSSALPSAFPGAFLDPLSWTQWCPLPLWNSCTLLSLGLLHYNGMPLCVSFPLPQL